MLYPCFFFWGFLSDPGWIIIRGGMIWRFFEVLPKGKVGLLGTEPTMREGSWIRVPWIYWICVMFYWVSRNWRTKNAFYISELDLNDMKYKYHEISKIRPLTWIFDQLGTHFQDVWTWSQKRLQDCDLLLPMNQDAKHRNRTRKHAVALPRMC